METFTQKGRTPFSKRSSICSWLFGLIFLLSGFIGGQAQVASFNITKVGPPTADPGDLITYVIHFSNYGTAYATDVVVTDHLPNPGLYTYVSSIPAGVYDAGNNKVTWTKTEMPILAHLGAGDNQIIVKVRAGTMGSTYHPLWNQNAYYMPGVSSDLLNYASVESTGVNPVNSTTVTTHVDQTCEVVIDDMHGETKSSTDYVAYFLMNLTNLGNISDNFQLSAVEATGSQSSLIVEFTDLNQNLITSSGWIAPNDVFFYYLKVTTPNGTPANTYNLTDVTATSTVCPGTSYTTTVNIKILNPLGPVLNIIKSDDPDPVYADSTITYTLFILNTGKSEAENFTVTENYSSNVDFVSATPAPTTGNNVWNLPNLGVGASVTITITVHVHPNLPNGTLILNTAIASGTDNHGNEVSDSDTEKTTVHSAPNLQITKTAVPTPFPAKPDQDIVYTLTYINMGNYPATGVVISDNYDEAYTYVTNTGGGNDDGSTISWTIGTLPIGMGGTLTYTVRIKDVSNFNPGTTYVTNTATIMLNEVDEDYLNNVASAITLVNLLPDLSVSKTASATPAHVGADFNYVISVANNGDMSAQATVLQDVLPANLQFVSASDGGTETGGVVTWTLGTMGISATLQRSVTVKPLCASAGNITNVVSISSTTVDANENDNTYSLTTAVTDNTPPVVTCPSNISQNVDPSNCYATVTVSNPLFSDNCGVTAVYWVMTGATTGASPLTGMNYIGTHQFNKGITTVTYTVQDAGANTASCSFTVTITDNVPPTITCPGNQVRNANTGVCSYTTVGTEFDPTSFSDHCPGTTVSNNLNLASSLAGYAFPKGITTVVWTAKDASNNTATCSFTVTVNDIQVPTITCPGNQTRNTNLNVCTYAAVGTEFDPLAYSDLCPGATISNNLNSGTTLAGYVFPKGITTVTWTVTDASSNTASCSFTVTVSDNQAPSITCPGNIQVNNDPGVCGAVVTYSVTTSDNCPGETSSQIAGRPSGSVFPVGNTVNTFQVTDASGNSATCTFTVNVKDIELPVINCPGNITQASDPGVCGAVVTFTVTASDNCPGFSISQDAGLASGATFPVGTTNNTFRVTDASGNTSTCNFSVTVTDGQAPSVTCPGNQTRNTNLSVCQYTTVGTEFNPVSFTDNCPGTTIRNNLNLSATLAGYVFYKGTTNVIWTAQDAAGNTSTCSFTVTINDNEYPSIECQTDKVRNTDPGVCYYTVIGTEFNPAGFNDNCAGATIINDFNNSNTLAGAHFPKGVTIVTWTVTDASNNATSCSFTVTVNDIEKPNITCVTNQTRNANNATCTYTTIGTEFDPTAFSDNCPGAVIINNYNNLNTLANAIFAKGTTSVIWTVTDASGNTRTCSFSVTVIDNQVPSITCVSNQVRSTNPGVCTYTVVDGEFAPVSYSDNCSGSTISNDFNHSASLEGAIFPKGVTVVTWTITDASGNSASCSFSVTVNDNENPTISCVADQIRSTDAGTCTYTAVGAEFNPVSYGDNCSGSSITNNYNGSSSLAGAVFAQGTTTVVWTVTDASNSTSTCSFTITVNDHQNPSITCVGNQSRSTNNGVCTYTTVGTEFNPISFSDNCPGATITNDYNSSSTLAGAVFQKGSITVTWTVTDASGNKATCSLTITITDNELPTISCVGNQSRNTNTGVCSYTAAGTEFDPIAFQDNCSGSAVSNNYNGLSSLAGASFPKGTTTVTWTVMDATGNTASCSFTVTVSDLEVPTITCPVHIFQAVDAGQNYATIITPNPITGDNCAVTLLTWTLSGATSGSSPATGINYLGTHIFYLGVTTVVYVVGDAAGNTATCSFDITVTDNEAPVITCPGNITQNVDPGVCYAMVINPNPVITDNGVIALVTWTLSGATTGSSPATGINYVGIQQFNVGITTVSYYVEDEGGNPAGCSYTVTVIDNINPSVACPSNITQNNDAGFCYATVVTPNPVASDNCTVTEQTWALGGATTGNSPATGINNLGTHVFNKGITTVTYTVEDAAGNTGTCSFTVTINDTENPTITCKANQSRNTNAGVCTYTAVGTEFNPVSFNDNCPGATIQNDYNSSSTLSGAIFPKGITTVIWTVTDASGNTATCSFTITVTDNENPSIVCPGNQVRSTNPGVCNYTVIGTEFNPVSYGDNCSGSTIINNYNSGNTLAGAVFQKGTTTVLWTVTDASGNTATCSFTVTINDTEIPVITCPGTQTRSTNTGVCTYTAVDGEFNPVSFSDNCPGSTIINYYNNLNTLAGAIFPKGTTSVIWKVTDASGNTATCSFNVIVNDNENPTISCVTNQVRSTNNGVCTYTVTDGEFDPVAYNDNCTGSTIQNNYNNSSTLAGAIFPKGTTTVIWTVTDASGNTATCSFTVTVNDNETPTISCVPNQVRSTNTGVCTYTAAGSEFDPLSFNDNCTGATILNNYTSSNTLAGAIFPKGVTTVIWTVTDASGNTSTCSFTVTVNDNENPTITCVTNQIRNTDPGVCTYTAAGTEFNPVSFNDNCTGSTILNNYNSSNTLAGAIFPKGVTTVIWTVTDASGNSASCSFTVTVSDNENPTITCVTNQVRNTDPGVCTYTAVGTEFNPVAFSDNCSGSTVLNNYNGSNTLAGAIFPKGVTTVIWTVTDASGNAATCSFTVTITDNEDPTITCVGNQSRNTNPGVCTYTAIDNEFNPVAFNDNCTGSTISNDYNNGSTLAGAIFPKGTTTVTWTVTDASGNTATCSFTITVSDNEDPTITCPGNIIQNVDPNQSYATITPPNPVTGDNCAVTLLTWTMSGATTGSSPTTGINYVGTQLFNLGVTTINYHVEDAAGNSADCSFTVTVNDNVPPVIICPTNISQNVDAGVCYATVVNPNPVITDNGLIVLVTWTLSGATTGSSPATGINYVGTQQFNVGITTVSYYVEDAAGNSAACSYTVTVTDNLPPTIDCPSDINQTTDEGVCLATVITPDPATGDNCSVTGLTWILSGATTGSSASTGINNLGTHPFNKGITTVTYTVTDASGNTTTCSYTVTVTDDEEPTISCITDQTRTTDPGVCTYTAVGNEFNPMAFNDNCPGSTISNDYNSGSTLAGAIFPKGTTTIIWTITDAAGNVATCSFSVTVNDTENPTISCVTNQTRDANAGVCTYTTVGPEFNPVAFSDNCTGSTILNDFNNSNTLAGAIFPNGTTTVIWTVTDASGNTATCSFTVTVNDNEDPYIGCVEDQSRNTDPGVCTYTAVGTEFDPTTYYDNCPGETVSNDFNNSSTLAGAIFPKGTTTIIWTVTDASGNTATCSFSLTVNDVEDPTITCVENQVRSTDPGVCTYTAVGNEFNPVAFSDNCTGSTISNDYNSGSTLAGAIFPKGTTTITWTVTDASGNTAVCSFTVTVNDTELPTITCVENQVRSTDPGVCTYTAVGAEFNPISFSDNCTGSVIINDYNSTNTLAGAVFQKGTTTIIWTVTDDSGNTATCSFTLTINDTEDPTISCVTDQTRNTDAGVCTYTAVGNEFNPVAFSDNCPGFSVSNDYNGTATLAGAVFPKGTTTITWTVTDASGNTAACSFTLTVNDLELPVIICPANIVQLVDPLTCFATVTVPLPGISDNCPGVYAINSFNGTGNASGIYPAGITLVVWTVYDAAGNSATCLQTIEITNYPVANDDNATTLEDTPVTVPVLANDSDCENSMLPSTVTVVTTPAHGTTLVNLTTGDITYSPNLNYYGPDTFEYRVCNADALCDTASVFINVLPVNDPPVIINENISLCENTSVNGNVLANGDADTVENTTLTVTLPQVAGPFHGTFILLANGDFTYTPVAHYFGSDMVVVSICDNGFPLPPQCVNDTIFIDVMEAVTALAGADQELCNAASTTLSGSSPVPGTGNWTQIDGPNTVTILPQNSPTATVTGMIPGTYNFMYTVTTGICSTMDSMMVVNYHLPTPANAGTDQDLCLNGNPSTSTVMAANTPQFGTGVWAQISGPTTANIANPTSPTTTVSNLIFGVYKFTWSVSIGVCAPSVDTVQVSVWYLSSANAGPDATICEGDTLHIENSTASNYLTLLWGTTGSGTFTNPNILNPSYIPSIGDITAGTVKLYLTSFGHAPCAPVADTMVLTIIRAAVAEAGPDISTCQMQPITITTASASYYSSVLWTHNGQGTLLNNNTLTPTYTPAPTETGTITLVLTAYGNSPCGMDIDSTHLTMIPFPEANAGPDGYSCQNMPFTIYNATASNYAAVLWTENGPGYLTNANTLTPTYHPAPDETDTVMLVMQVWGLYPCGVTSDFMYLYFNEEAVVSVGTDLLSCSQNAVSLDQAVAKNYTWLHWHSSGTGTFNDSTILHPIYYPSAQDVADGSVMITLTANGLGACPAVTDTLILTLTAPPAVDAGENEASCVGMTFVINDATAENYSSLLWTHNGAGVLNNPTTLTPTYVPAPTETGNITFTLTVQGIEPCAGNADQKIVTINPQAVVSAGPDAQICEDEDYLLADASGQNYADVSWQSTGTGTFDNPLSLNPTYNPSTTDITQGSVKLILTATPLGGCSPASDTLVLSISKLPVVTAGPDVQVCPGTQVLLDDATASNYSTAQWTANGIPLEMIPGTLSVNYYVPNPSPGVVNMEITVWGTGGCADRSVSDGLLLISKSAPMVDAGPDQSITSNSSTTLEANVWGGSGDYSYSWNPGDYLINPSVEDPTTVILNSTTTFVLTVTDKSSGCVTSDSVTVMVAGTHLPPVAVNDYDSTNANIPVTLNPMANDYDPTGGTITYEILEGPFVGQVNPISDSLLSYTPMPNFEGNDSIIYVIYDSDAIPETDTAVIYIHIGSEIPLNIHNVITPNGDGFNDTWVIDGIDAYTDNDVNIFNRWGDKVKSFTGYNNTSVVWNGTNKHNEPLPDGTYFYIIHLPNVGNFKGWVYIRVNSQ